MERRVVITAQSAITPIGQTDGDILDALTGGRSGVKALEPEAFLYDLLNSRVFARIDYPIDYNFHRKYSKTMGPVGFYACKVAERVFEKAGLQKDFMSSGRLGVAFGSTQGSPTVQREIMEVLFHKDPKAYMRLNAAEYLRSMNHTTAANICRMFEITGRVISSSTACTTGSQSIGYGFEAVKFGLAEAMLCGAADEYDTVTLAVFDKLLAASGNFNARPTATPRPFDADRDGLVIGEGGAAVLLEEYEFAKKRGADILAEVLGFACCDNGGDMILPRPEGIEATIRTGLISARLNPEEVDYVSAHATATKIGDIAEAMALGRVYGRDGALVSGLKGYVGHTMGTCGAMETIFVLHMLEKGLAIPTLNLENIDPDCAMINHTPGVAERPLKVASVQNFAFGGVNTCLFLKKLD